MVLPWDLLSRLSWDLDLYIRVSIWLASVNLHALVEIRNLLRTVEILSCLVHLALLYLRKVYNVVVGTSPSGACAALSCAVSVPFDTFNDIPSLEVNLGKGIV